MILANMKKFCKKRQTIIVEFSEDGRHKYLSCGDIGDEAPENWGALDFAAYADITDEQRDKYSIINSEGILLFETSNANVLTRLGYSVELGDWEFIPFIFGDGRVFFYKRRQIECI